MEDVMVDGRTGTGGKARIWQIGLVVLVVLVVGGPTLLYPFGKDQGEYAYIGAAFARGEVVYRDVFNVKPPLTHVIHAGAIRVFGPYMSSIRIVDLLWQMGTAVTLFSIGVTLWRRWGWGLLAAVFYAVTYYQTDFWHTAQTDGFINLPIALSVLFVVRPLSGKRPRDWHWLMAGVMVSLAVLLKYPIGLMLPIFIVVYWLSASKRQERPILLLITGFVLPLLGFLLWLLSRGALADFLEIQLGYIPEYNAGFVTADNYLAFTWQMFSQAFETGLYMRVFLGVLALALLVLIVKRPKKRVLWLLPLWGLAALVHLAIQNKYYPYHALPLLAPLALLGAYLFQSISAVVGSKRPGLAYGVAGSAAVLVLLMIVSLRSPYFYGDLEARYRPLTAVASGEMTLTDYYQQDSFGAYGWPVFSSRANLEVADYLFIHTRPEDEVFIWAFEPAIYFLSQRHSASRFIYNFPLYGQFAWPEFRQQVVDELTAEPPEVILVANGDAQPWLTGTQIDSAVALQEFPALNEIVTNQYQLTSQIAQFSVYHRRHE